MRVFLWLLNEVGISQVPSFNKLRAVQQTLREGSGVPTVNWKSPKGNTFSFNNPATIIANVSC